MTNEEKLLHENTVLKGKLKLVLLCVDTIKENAVKEFAEKIKNEVYPFLQAEWFNVKIDEILREYLK